MTQSSDINVICMKWGTAYTADDVNILQRMVSRNLARTHRFVCFTDDATGLGPAVESLPLPAVNVPVGLEHEAWRKLGTFSNPLADLSGTALFLDLDIVIVDALEPFFEHPGQFCIIHNWTHPHRVVGNSSVYRFEVNSLSWVLDAYNADPHGARTRYRNEQSFLSHQLVDAGHTLSYWPAEWCVSFKKHCMPPRLLAPFKVSRKPEMAKIVVFHGRPKPADAIAGDWQGRWKRMRPTPWVRDYWF